MANVLAGLGGLFTGLAQGAELSQSMALRALQMAAMKQEMGLVPTASLQDPSQAGAAAIIPHLDASQATQGMAVPVAGTSDSLPTDGSALPPQAAQASPTSGTGTQPMVGSGPSLARPTPLSPPVVHAALTHAAAVTPSGKPTDQASQIRQARAQRDTGKLFGQTAGAIPTTQQLAQRVPPPGSALQALAAAAAAVPQGNPFANGTPGNVPNAGPPYVPPQPTDTFTDPVTGQLAQRYVPSPIKGEMFDMARNPQNLRMLEILKQAELQRQMQLNQQAFAEGQQGRAQMFQSGQTDKEIAAAQERQRLDTALRIAEMDRQARQFEVMTGFRQTQQEVKAMDDITKPLGPIEQQAGTIRSALRELDIAKTNPGATTAANISAAMAQVAAASPRLNEGLAGLAGKGMDPSLPGTWQRFFSEKTAGLTPAQQITNAQAALRGELNEVDQNWQRTAIAGATGHPELSDGLSRVQLRHAAFFPESQGFGQGQGTQTAPPANAQRIVIGPKTRAAAANPKDPNHAKAVQLMQQAHAQEAQ